MRVSGAQAAGCSPVATAFASGSDHVRPVRPDTIAKSLAIGNPADGWYALEIVRSTGGALADVTDEEIVDGIELLARTEGIFAETAGGVTIAVLAKLAAAGVVRRDERVVAYVTGNGLKTVEALRRRIGPTATIAPTLEAFTSFAGPLADLDAGPASERHRPHPDPAAPAHRRRGEVVVDGSTVSEVIGALEASHPGHRRPPDRRRRGAAALRQRLCGRGGRPLPRGPRHPREGRPDPLDRPCRRRRLTGLRLGRAGAAGAGASRRRGSTGPAVGAHLHVRPHVVCC